MMAAIGKQLKQSVKVFHSLILYLLLPNMRKRLFQAKENRSKGGGGKDTHIRRKIHKFD
jgi:hypothetical protein